MTGEPGTGLASGFLKAIATVDLPDIGPAVRKGRSEATVLRAVVDKALAGAKLEGVTQLCLWSAALFWHDHLDASHSVSQGIPTPDGSMLHGMMHRREPDYGNGAYWFRRVGEHAVFPAVAAGVRALSERNEPPALAARWAKSEVWKPFEFIDACEAAAKLGAEDPARRWLREVQRIEFECLVAHLLKPKV